MLQSDQYRGLDRSEKGAVSFFLGQVSAKHFAEHLLGSPVFTRVDEALEVAGLPVIGRRPDFHGYGPRVGVFATEAKGRSGIWNAKLMRDAKAQALNLPPVLGGGPHRAVAHAAYFERRQWKARIEDPPPTRLQRGPSVEAVLYAYYRPLVLLLEERDGPDFELDGEIYAMAELSEVDLRIGVRRDLLSAATAELSPEGRGAKLRLLIGEPGYPEESDLLAAAALALDGGLARAGMEVDSGRSVGADGVLLLAGRAWEPRVMLMEPGSRSEAVLG